MASHRLPRHLVAALTAVLLLASACTGGELAPTAAESNAAPAAGNPAAPGSAAPAPPPPATASPTTPAPSPPSPATPPPAPTTPPPAATPPPASREVIPFDAGYATAFATRLANEIGVRAAGSPADAQARRLVAAELQAAGWTVAEEAVALPQGGTTANVVAWRGGAGPGTRHIVIGGHLDTVAVSPGANDNGSGVGVLVSVARALSGRATAVPLVLVAFGAEEYQPSEPSIHHVGSEAYAAAHAYQVAAMLSVDMLAVGEPTCICWLDLGPDTLAARLTSLAPPTGFETSTMPDYSDHGPFARRGIPAVLITTPDDGRYHTPNDTADYLEEADIRRAGELVLAFVSDLGPEDGVALRRS